MCPCHEPFSQEQIVWHNSGCKSSFFVHKVVMNRPAMQTLHQYQFCPGYSAWARCPIVVLLSALTLHWFQTSSEQLLSNQEWKWQTKMAPWWRTWLTTCRKCPPWQLCLSSLWPFPFSHLASTMKKYFSCSASNARFWLSSKNVEGHVAISGISQHWWQDQHHATAHRIGLPWHGQTWFLHIAEHQYFQGTIIPVAGEFP